MEQLELFSDTLSEPKPSDRVAPSKKQKKSVSPYRKKFLTRYFPPLLECLEFTGSYQMPVIQPFHGEVTATEAVPFDKISYCDGDLSNKIVVFYTHDIEFDNKIAEPDRYVESLKRFPYVVGPDLSQYIDMPYSIRMNNSFWNKAITARFQKFGVPMIPNVTWSTPDTYQYSIEGFPKHSVIAINSMGCRKYDVNKFLWRKGYTYMVEHLDPTLIVRYGPKMPGEREDISLYLEHKQLNLLKNGRKR